MAMNLQADTAAIKKVATNLKSYSEQYKSEITKVNNNIETLKKNWTGSDNQAYVSSVESHKSDMDKLGNVIKESGEYLEKVSKILEQTRQNVAAAAKKL